MVKCDKWSCHMWTVIIPPLIKLVLYWNHFNCPYLIPFVSIFIRFIFKFHNQWAKIVDSVSLNFSKGNFWQGLVWHLCHGGYSSYCLFMMSTVVTKEQCWNVTTDNAIQSHNDQLPLSILARQLLRTWKNIFIDEKCFSHTGQEVWKSLFIYKEAKFT